MRRGQNLVVPELRRLSELVGCRLREKRQGSGECVCCSFCVAIALVLLDAADVVDALPGDWTGAAVGVLAGYFLLGVAMNAVSQSHDERRTMTPVALVLCLLCAAIVVSM